MLFSLLGIVAVAVVILGPIWKANGDRGGQRYAEPFRIAGNLYYVGANDVTSFLITGPEGHVLIDGGYPATPTLIMASIAKLGFNIKDVKVLLNSDPHSDHAGGLATLQKASGAQVWASEAGARIIAGGGDDPDLMLHCEPFSGWGSSAIQLRELRGLPHPDPVAWHRVTCR